MIIKNKIIFFTLLSCIIYSCKIQKKITRIAQTECDSLYFDLNIGMINSVSPRLQQSEIREWFTCYTSIIPDGDNSNCGGGIIYANHSFIYYTFANFVEINKNFKGKISSPLMGIPRNEAFHATGAQMEFFQRPEYPENDFFLTDYGCLRLDYKSDTVVAISAHLSHCENVDVCIP